MNIAYISGKPDENTLKKFKADFEECHSFTDAGNMVSSGREFACVVTDFTEENGLTTILQTLRRSEKHFLVPVFHEQDGIRFTDGGASNPTLMKDRIKELAALSGELKNVTPSSWESRILSYLYTRKNLSVKPEIDRHLDKFYHYPIVDLFYPGTEDYAEWLETLAVQGILTRTKLADRLSLCPTCSSPHIRYTDNCPHCGSINIENRKLMNCLKCGYLANDEVFAKHSKFVCPSCKAKLKFHEKDYGFPPETGVCLDCGESYIKSIKKMSCISCGKTVPENNVIKQNIFEYKLSSYGFNQIKFGAINISSMLTDGLNYVNLEYFHTMLEWMVQIQKRYDDMPFSLIALKTDFYSNLLNYELLMGFAKTLRANFRKTDVCSRIDNNTLILMYPRTSQEGLDVIKARIMDFAKNVKEVNNPILVKIEGFTSTKDNIGEETGRMLVARLVAKL